MESITETLVMTYAALMIGSAVIALAAGELKRRRDLVAIKVSAGQNS